MRIINCIFHWDNEATCYQTFSFLLSPCIPKDSWRWKEQTLLGNHIPREERAESKRMTMGETGKTLPIQKVIVGCIGKFCNGEIAYTGKSILHPIQPSFGGQLYNIPVLQIKWTQLHLQFTAQLPQSEGVTFFHPCKQQSCCSTEPAIIRHKSLQE